MHKIFYARILLTEYLFSFSALIGRLSAKFRRLTALKTDKRVRLVNEVISGIQVIKMYAWEKSFISLMKSARKYDPVHFLFDCSLAYFP